MTRRGAIAAVRATGAIVAATLALAACSGSGDGDEAAVAASEAPAQTLFIVGSGTSVGDELPDPLRQAWPRLLFSEAFPASTILVNGAAGPSTAASALEQQLPLAQELRPETVAAWLGSYDLNQGTPAPEFGAGLRELLAGLVADGSRVFIADIPRLPAFDDELRRAYNAEIGAAASATGAELVAIADLELEPVSDDADYQPDASGHRAIADAFVDALDAS